MNAADVLIRQLEREQDSFLRTIKLVPEDKLDWSPGEGLRSARDQFQEVATVVGDHWELYESKRMEWNEASFAEYLERRKKYHTLEDLEARSRQDTAKLIAFVRDLPAEELMDPVQMPWPGDHRLVDNVTYHLWNMSYHEGQVSAILQRLGINPMPG
jgi:uncharacterized damage-inducible protein DinB